MKKLLILATTLLIALTLSACSSTMETDVMSSKNALGVLSYISSSLLDESVENEAAVSVGWQQLSATTEEDPVEPQTEIEEELEQVNIYMDKLKSFIEFGASGFGSIEEETSDRPEYAYMVRISVEENEFLLYYNIDLLSNEITGLFILDGVEYIVTAENNLSDADEFEQQEETEIETETETDDETAATTPPSSSGIDQTSNEDEDDDEFDQEDEDDDEFDQEDEDDYNDEYDHEDDDEVKYGMRLIATNGDDVIIIEYKVKQEEDERKETFLIEKNIGGIVSEIEMNIKVEEDEYVLEIIEDGNEYKFKMEQESDGEVEYKLEYKVDGVNGEVEITVTTNELGETVYTYDISEDGEEIEVEMEDPDDDDDDDDEYEDEHEEEDETEM